MGESGAGKTTAMRELPPEQTFYIDCDGKGLSWRGWKGQFNSEKKNYLKTNDALKVLRALQVVNQDKKFKYVVVDTINGIMVSDEMRRMTEKGYDKWIDLATSVWQLVDEPHNYREDLTIIFTAHSETDRDDNGYAFTRIKTNGKKLNKIVLESKFTTVILCKSTPDGKHVFETHSKNSTAKTPYGAYGAEEMEVENNIMEVLKRLEEF